MPRTIVLEDGTEEEVPTPEELQALQEKATKAETLEQDLVKLKAEAEDKSNPDWALARKKMKKMQEALEKEGRQVGEDGTVINPQEQQLSTDEIVAKATEAATKAATQTSLDRYKDEMLSSYNEEDRKVVEHYYSKLSVGEELSYEKVRQLVQDAARHLSPSSSTAPFRAPSGSGAPPRYDIQANGQQAQTRFAETEEGESTAKEIWGSSAFPNAKQ